MEDEGLLLPDAMVRETCIQERKAVRLMFADILRTVPAGAVTKEVGFFCEGVNGVRGFVFYVWRANQYSEEKQFFYPDVHTTSEELKNEVVRWYTDFVRVNSEVCSIWYCSARDVI